MKKASYNERLFGGGLRRYIHLARFNWLKRKCEEYEARYDLVVELGCYDGKSIEFLPNKPKRYYGFDAGWEDGIYDAMKKYRDEAFTFIVSSSPSDLAILSDKATLVISLETLEHISPDTLEDYLMNLCNIMITKSHFIITVPNEKGIIFLLKYIIKNLIYGNSQEYSLREICAATLGWMPLVKRNDHKGFNWESLVDQLERYFSITEVNGVQLPMIPPSLNLTIGIVCRKET